MSSLLQQYLGTNYVPSTLEIHQIKEILAPSDQELREVDDEINQLQQELQSLLEEQSTALNLAAHYSHLLSPARRLHRDVLQEIFLACLPTDRNPSMIVTEAPMLLTHICSSWRSIAHSIPSLWSSVHIVIPCVRLNVKNSEKNQEELDIMLKLEQRQARAIEWFKRSCGYPLSISVYQTHDTSFAALTPHLPEESSMRERETQLHMSFLTTTLLPFCDRWKEIDLCLSHEVTNRLLKNDLNTRRTPKLRSLHIVTVRIRPLRSIRSHPLSFLEWDFMDILGIPSSRLTHISALRCVLRKSDLSHIPHSTWGQLKELNLYSTYTSRDTNQVASFKDVIQNVLRHCQSLETLKLSMYTGMNHPDGLLAPDSVRTIILPRLKHLTIGLLVTYEPKDQLSIIVNNLFCPSLEHLNIETNGLLRYSDIIKTLLRNNGQSVWSLGWYGLSGRRSDSEDDINIVVELLQLLPNLKCLKLTSDSLDSAFTHWPVSFSIPRATASRTRNSETTFTELVNDDLLYALSPVGKTYSEIVCPQLEELHCSPKLSTMVSASALRELIVARQNAHLSDNRVASLGIVCIKLNEYRQLDHAEESQAFLEENFNVQFKAPPSYVKPALSPFEGL